jgi:hypothetical protein
MLKIFIGPTVEVGHVRRTLPLAAASTPQKPHKTSQNLTRSGGLPTAEARCFAPVSQRGRYRDSARANSPNVPNGKPMRPDVALAFDRLAAAAREEAGLFISISSGFRSDAEQARLFAAHPDPKWVAPPGESLHRYATELDLGPPAAYAWLAANATRFGFLQRYSWEAWH